MITLRAALLAVCLATAAEADPVLEAMDEYASFAPFDAGIISPAQFTDDIAASVQFIDTRTAEAYREGTIPGATHIDWREVFARIDEIPQDGKVVLFCETGAVSAQAAFGLRVLGRENVLVLQTGLAGWREHGGALTSSPAD